MSALPYRVGIVGLGNIAAGYDRPGSDDVQTHIKACLTEPRFRLAAICDRDPARAQAVRAEWQLGAPIVTIDEMIAQDLEVICISTPEDSHLELLGKIAKNPPRLILCEKPLARDPVLAEQTVGRFRQSGCALAVNHQRRWIPELRDWLARARAGEFGRSLSATAHYSSGFWQNGGHVVDLIVAFLGETITTIRDGHALPTEARPDDPALSVTFDLQDETGLAPVWIQGIDGRQQTIFDVEILFEAARIRIEDQDGVCARLDLPAPLIDGAYAPELRASAHYRDQPRRLMATVWRNLADHLETGEALASDAADALAVLRVQAAIARSVEHFPRVGDVDHG